MKRAGRAGGGSDDYAQAAMSLSVRRLEPKRWSPSKMSPEEPSSSRSPDHAEFLARVAGGLAHEIKNPLSTMAINLTLLEEEFQPAPGGDGALSAQAKRSLKRIRTLQREVGRLEGILDDFLRFARGGEVNRAASDLVALVRETLEFASPELEAESVRLHALLPNAMPLVMLDEGTFRQALLNLIVNARQAMPGGGELIVELRRDGASAELTITDSGVGMNADQLARCFDLYYSTKKGGTGLGLATVRRIVEMHGGEIAVQSDEGRGTRFHIWLPLLQEITLPRDSAHTSKTPKAGFESGFEDGFTAGSEAGPDGATNE